MIIGIRNVYFAYADESGDSGYVNSPTKFFVLSCLLVHESDWRNTLDLLIEMRRVLRSDYKIPPRAELKAEDFVYGRGPLAPVRMSRQARMDLFGKLLSAESTLSVRTFAIAIAKERILAKDRFNPRELAWVFLTQRLDTFCRKQDPSDTVMLFPDEGHGHLVRKIIRKARRFQMVKGFYGGQLDIKSRFILEDPIDKQSSQSYFTQVADWNAYAAHRYKDIDPIQRIPPDLWDRLDDIRLVEVNGLRALREYCPPAIVVWP